MTVYFLHRRRSSVKSVHGDFLTGDEFKYAPEKRLNGQSEVFYFTANENPRSLQTVH